MDHKLKNNPLACLNQGEKHAGWVWAGGGKSANGRTWCLLVLFSSFILQVVYGGENEHKF